MNPPCYETILVTGGAGFIGSNLAISFKKKYPEIKVVALDNLKRRGSELNISRLMENAVEFIHGDIRTPEDLKLNIKVDLLIECSAEPSVLAGYSDNPAYLINTNLVGTVNCLDMALRNKADIIFLSTSRVYPYEAVNSIKVMESDKRFEWIAGQDIPGWSMEGIDVDFTLSGPRSLYGATKLCSEVLLQEYIDIYGIRGVIDRCGVIAGPWQFGKVDQGVITLWILAHYFKKRLTYIGFGGKGKQVRDVLHIDDLFRLIDLQARSIDKITGKTFNVGGSTFSNVSLMELTELCADITGNKIPIGSELENRPGDIIIYISDNRRAYDYLLWEPRLSLSKTVEDIFNWVRENEKSVAHLIN